MAEAYHSDGQLLVNVRALSDARFHEEVKLGEVLCARSIKPFEWSRPRLRRTRAAMGIAWMKGAVHRPAVSAQRSGTENQKSAIATRQASWLIVEQREA
ncbi:MAG: hypothetical protein WA741_09155 [Candidatus Sulfotelmatobacter sp.]